MKTMPLILCLLFAVLPFADAQSQEIALKTNILYDATLTVNVGVEVTVAPKWSVDLSGNFNGWTLSDGKRWKHWMVQPEVRYWLCQATGGHFFAAHLLGGQYNFGAWDGGMMFLGTDFRKLKDLRYQGWGAGAGIAYGYSWILGKHWNIEAEIGIGWVYSRYDVFPCAGCGRKIESDRVHNYVGPTKAAVNLVYVF